MDNIIIEIHNPDDKTQKKFEAAVEALAKAMKVTVPHVHGEERTEPTPYPALQELSELVRVSIQEGLRKLFEAIVTSWLRVPVSKALEWELQGGRFEKFSKAVGDEPFKLNGFTYLNPSTGMPLTRKEWEAIAKDLDYTFGYLFGDTERSLVLRAMALGKILQGYPVADATQTGLGAVLSQVDGVADSLADDPAYQSMMDFAQIHTGELIQDLTSTARKKIVATIIDAQKNRLTARETEDKLFEQFADLNRDWRRIAETETATNFNNGYLIAEGQTKTDPGEFVFMRGVSGADACSFCRENVNGKVVVLLDTAPSTADDTVVVNGTTYTAIWPGKNNFGRRAANWWVSAGTQHPHCLIAGQEVSPLGGVRGASRRKYSGDVVELRTVGGRSLVCTPNHPILSRSGFIPAGSFNIGDEVGYYPLRDGVAGVRNDNDIQAPSLIEDVVSSFFKSSRVASRKVPVSSEDFHGDGVGSEVAVIGANGLLRDDIYSALFEFIHKTYLRGGDVVRALFDGLRVFALPLERYGRAAYGVVGGANLVGSFFESHLRPLQELCFAGASRFNSLGEQSAANNAPAHSVLFGKGVLGDSRRVQIDKLIGGKRVLYEFPRSVPFSFDRVVHVYKAPFEGDVYNIETKTGYYIAGGIVNHNCRCSWIRFKPGMQKYYDMLDEAMNKQYEDAKKRGVV